MIFSEQSASTRLKSGPGFFGIMLWAEKDHLVERIRQAISATVLSACGGDLSRMQDAFSRPADSETVRQQRSK
jgi:hypothetical protein